MVLVEHFGGKIGRGVTRTIHIIAGVLDLRKSDQEEAGRAENKKGGFRVDRSLQGTTTPLPPLLPAEEGELTCRTRDGEITERRPIFRSLS